MTDDLMLDDEMSAHCDTAKTHVNNFMQVLRRNRKEVQKNIQFAYNVKLTLKEIDKLKRNVKSFYERYGKPAPYIIKNNVFHVFDLNVYGNDVMYMSLFEVEGEIIRRGS